MNPIEMLIAERVELALTLNFRCELANPDNGQPMSKEERRGVLTRLFGEMVKGMGVERFAETPVERLDQFAVISVVKSHDTGGMLKSLVNSFMIAYGHPETADRAFAALLTLEALRGEVAGDRGQTSRNQRLVAAASALDDTLTQQFPLHTTTAPAFRIIVGADRLFVSALEPIRNLPHEICGVPVEFMPLGPAPVTH